MMRGEGPSAGRRHLRRRRQFSIEEAQARLRALYPGAPETVIEAAALRLGGRAWRQPLAISRAARLVVGAILRHRFTDYDALQVRHGLSREEAMEAVRPEIEEQLRAWGRSI